MREPPDKVKAIFLALETTRIVMADDKRANKDGVIYEPALPDNPRTCPNCKKRTLWPCTWVLQPEFPKDKVLVLACTYCSEGVFEHHKPNGTVAEITRGNVNRMQP